MQWVGGVESYDALTQAPLVVELPDAGSVRSPDTTTSLR